MSASAGTPALALIAFVLGGALIGAASTGRTTARIVRSRAVTLADRAPRVRRSSIATSWRAGISAIDRRRARRLARPNAGAVAELLDQAARHCSSGESLSEAFIAAVEVSPLAGMFVPAVAALRTGHDIDRALDQIHIGHPDVALAVHVVRLSASQGGSVSEALDRAASTLRERDAIARERVAQSAQARLSGRVLTVLPLAFGGWTAVTTPSVQQFLATLPGVACVTLGLALNLGGWAWMARLTRGDS